MEENLDQSLNRQVPKSRNFVVYGLVAVLIIISLFVGIVIGLNRQIDLASGGGSLSAVGRVINTDSLPDYLTKDVNFKLFWRVWDMIKTKYIDRDRITDAQLFYGALRGVLAALEDPYSVFLNPQNSKEFNDELDGKFEGIGAEIGIRQEILTVISPLPGSPAEKTGIKSLDKIIEIDGISTAGMDLDQAVNLIRGDQGTTVVLTIAREGLNELKEITVTRETIKINSVALENKQGFAYIKVSNFNSDTSGGFLETANEIIKSSYPGIILDLRNNPGGFLDTAVDLAGYWVEEGQVVVREEFNEPELNQQYLSSGNAQFKGIKTVILVNAGSASASEIVAGALQDYGLATVVGETTFGKGSVQELEQLSDGSSVKLTIARWITPQGRTIDLNGITPDVLVELTDEDYDQNKDPQLNKAFELLRQVE